MYISATALCAFGVTGLDNFAFRLLLFDFFSKLILGGPPDPDGHKPDSIGEVAPPPWAAFENHCFWYKPLLIFTISHFGSII